jgi:iron(III) transport system substrate-binding protein
MLERPGNPAYRGEVQMANAQSSGTSYVAIATFVQIMGEEAHSSSCRR